MALFGSKSKFKARKTVKLVQDVSGSAATDFSSLGDNHVNLTKRAQKVGISLAKRNLGGLRGRVVLLLDHSGSMFGDYANGTVQSLVERALGFALNIDTDGAVEIIAFDEQVYDTVIATVDNYQGIVDRELWHRGSMGSTVMSRPLERVKRIVEKSNEPVFLIIVGDGSPNREDKKPTKNLVIELAQYPVFVKFLAVRPVDFLAELDDLTDDERLLDNVDAKPEDGGKPILAMSDLEFADAMIDETDGWISKALTAGILTR
jgi:hypothetical protein